MALYRRTDRPVPAPPGTDPPVEAASPGPVSLPPPATPETVSRHEPPPSNEIVIETKTGRIRQAGADSEGAWLNEQRVRFERSLFAFTKGVLKRKLLSNGLHRWFCDSLTKRIPPYRKMRLIPRGHLKSSIVSEAMPIHMHIQPTDGNIYWPGEPGNELNIILCGEKKDLMGSHLRWIEQQWESNPLLRLWPHRCWDNPRRQSRKWNEDEMILPRETDYADPSLRVIGVDGAITGAHCKVLIKDDLISLAAANSQTVMQAAIDWHIASRALLAPYEETGLEYIIGCLPGESEVTLHDGTRRRIDAIQVDDQVWATDTHGQLEARPVEAVLFQGYAHTITVTTGAKSLQATPNHPFLVRRHRTLVWVRADALVVGDCLITLKEVEGRLEHAWMTEDFCWLFGFLLGDGWISTKPRHAYVCVAMGIDETLNHRVLDLCAEWFPSAPFYRVPMGFARSDNQAAAHALFELGFTGTAKTKRLPAWIFALPPAYRRAVLRGFCDADGHHDKKALDMYQVEIANELLLRDLRQLAMLCGVRTGRLRHRCRMIQAPNSKQRTQADCWSSSFNFATVDRCEVYHALYKLPVSAGLRQETITKIEHSSIAQPVYDLTVQGTPSFFANGFAVHNTKWAVSDLYSHIQERDPSVECITRSIVENGTAIWPEQFTPDVIDQLRRDHGTRFYLFYMNNANNPELVDFSVDDLRWFELSGGTEVVFEEDGRDVSLAKRMQRRVRDDSTSERFRGQPFNARNIRDIFSGREEYFRLKAR